MNQLVKTTDVGSMPFSLPFTGDIDKFIKGHEAYSPNLPPQGGDAAKFFENRVIQVFLDKVMVGLDVPSYPQFRDMNKMFLESINGLNKMKEGYLEVDKLSIPIEKTQIKEVAAIKNNLERIYEKIGREIKLKVCITGPYTLSCLFVYKDEEIFTKLSEVLLKIVEANLFDINKGRVDTLVLDEPTFGFIDDPLIDFGSDGRENLIKAWEVLFQKAKSKGVNTSIHLHDTGNTLFWDVKSLKILESHVDDPLYNAEKTKKKLESTDKFLKASISISIFDKLIKKSLQVTYPDGNEIDINEKIGRTWHEIKTRKQDPLEFIEDVETIQRRLKKIVSLFGSDRILHAGPECGLKSFPNYESALKCLERTSEAVKKAK